MVILNRLFRSLKEVRMNSPINKSSYYFHIKRLIKINRIDDGLIYLQITRGVAERDFKFPKNARPSLVMIAKSISLDTYDDNFKKGINVKQ